MPFPKFLIAGGLAVDLAVGGGAAIAHEFIDNPSTSAGGSRPLRPVRSPLTSTPVSIYDASKDAVTYIVADTPQGQATGSGFLSPATA